MPSSELKPEYDVIVVGTRVAGATVAALLGDAGREVLLIDAAALTRPPAGSHGRSRGVVIAPGNHAYVLAEYQRRERHRFGLLGMKKPIPSSIRTSTMAAHAPGWSGERKGIERSIKVKVRRVNLSANLSGGMRSSTILSRA